MKRNTNRVIKYFFILKIALRDKVHDPGRLLLQTIAYSIRVGIFIALYAYAFRYVGGGIMGVDIHIAAWSMAAYFVLLSVQMRGVFQDINEDVKNGTVEVMLNKPFHYLWYRALFKFGTGIPGGVISLVAAFIFLSLFVGLPRTSFDALWIVQLSVIVFFGLILAALVYVLVGLCAFWIENARPVYWIVDKTIMVFGGSYIPVALFPGALKAFAEYSPFGASMFATHAFYQDFSDKWMSLVIIQIAWIVMLGVLVVFFYEKARKTVSINGG